MPFVTSDVSTTPGAISILTTEELPIGFDFTKPLAQIAGGAISSPTARIETTDPPPTASGPAGALIGSPSVSGSTITQTVDGRQLTAGNTYRLTVTATLATNTLVGAYVYLVVPA